jgi:excisionase family DNA binding protein
VHSTDIVFLGEVSKGNMESEYLNADSLPDILKISEVAEYLRVEEKFVRKLINAKKIKCFRLLGEIRVRKVALLSDIESLEEPLEALPKRRARKPQAVCVAPPTIPVPTVRTPRIPTPKNVDKNVDNTPQNTGVSHLPKGFLRRQNPVASEPAKGEMAK